MDLSKILSISGQAGLYQMEAQRKDGVIVAQIGDDNKTFISARQHMFTPLENITIYTTGEGLDLKDVFQRMKAKEKDTPPVDPKSDGATLREYFTQIIPEHDQEQVYTSDIKKILKWYEILDGHGMITESNEENSEAQSEQKEQTEDESKADSDNAKKQDGGSEPGWYAGK